MVNEQAHGAAAGPPPTAPCLSENQEVAQACPLSSAQMSFSHHPPPILLRTSLRPRRMR